MSKMFPDSGVPWPDARNSLTNPWVTSDCKPLWYATNKCTPRFDPAAANAELSELLNLVNRGEVQYNCGSLNNVESAVRYIVQRGIPCGSYAYGGPIAYELALDPVPTRYNDYMTLVVIPQTTNQSAISLRASSSLPYVPVLRNDGEILRFDDFRAGYPIVISYWQGNWYLVSLARSQVPLVVVGAVNAWVRTDGNDSTGDGTANSPDKAFRTIQGAWNAVGSRYAASPLFQINVRLGIPGTYDSAVIGPFGGSASISGDPTNPVPYRIACGSSQSGPPAAVWGLRLVNTNFMMSGVNFVMNNGNNCGNGAYCLRLTGGGYWIDRCQFTLEASNPGPSAFLHIEGGATLSSINGQVFEGNGGTVERGFAIHLGNFNGSPPGGGTYTWYWNNSNFSAHCMQVANGSTCSFGAIGMANSNNTGMQYFVNANGILYAQGNTMPGNVAGVIGTQGLYFP